MWSERVYGIVPEQVVGSHGQVRYEMRDGKPVLVKTLDTIFVDDKESKPVGIHQMIGRRPVMAFGNSDGKLQQDLIDAVAPFTVETATSNAFVTTPDDLIIKPSLIEYVSTFVSKSTGESFKPHVTTGVAPQDVSRRDAKGPVRLIFLRTIQRCRVPAGPIRNGRQETEGVEL